MFTMELILATVFSQDVNLSSESENPLIRVYQLLFLNIQQELEIEYA